MTRTLALLALCLLTSPAPAADPVPLTPKQLADGWVKLFDGESTFGWPKGATVEKGKLVYTAAADKALEVALPATHSGEYEVDYTFRPLNLDAKELPSLSVQSGGANGKTDYWTEGGGNDPVQIEYRRTEAWRYSLPKGDVTANIRIPAGGRLAIAKFNFRPVGTKPIFDGKTLDGWKAYAGDPKRERSKFEVTKEGELRVSDGPGDLQTTSTHADFLLQFDCKTRGKNLNSGVFFRCLPGEYQAGYEAQIHNGYAGDDRTKPTDFGTGAVYRRVPARKVVSNDNEWFTMTVLAVGPTIRTWVNGEPVVNWTDDRPRDANARKGLRTAAGHLSIQGHDPTTDILFRNLRVLDIK